MCEGTFGGQYIQVILTTNTLRFNIYLIYSNIKINLSNHIHVHYN